MSRERRGKCLDARSVTGSSGFPGLRDAGLLQSELSRPLNRYAYDGVRDVINLASTCAVAISSDHPFTDSNKRMDFLAMGLLWSRTDIS